MSQGMELTNTVLKGIMTDTMVYRGTATTMNVKEPGIYLVREGVTADIPSEIYGYGVLEVLVTVSFIIQRYTPHENSAVKQKCGLWVRTHFQGTFSAWRQYTPVSW